MNDSADRPLPAALPLDLRRGLTDAADAAHPLRWGILGAGSIATQWVEALAACAGATVTARDRSRAEQFAARFGIATAYGDYAEMVAAPDVDIVYVGTITCWGSSTQTSSSGYGPIWTSGWQSMESRPEGRRLALPPTRIHQGRDVGGTGCGGLKALLSCHAISIIRALRFWTPGSTCTFWQMSAWKRFSTVPES